MGIEPTKHRFGRFIGFEDRGGHQTSKRFLGQQVANDSKDRCSRFLAEVLTSR